MYVPYETMTPMSVRLRRGRPGDLLEGHAFVDPRLPWQAQHALAEDVALDLVGAAPDGDRRCRKEKRQPLIFSHEAAETLDVDRQTGEILDRRRAPELGARSLGPGRPT